MFLKNFSRKQSRNICNGNGYKVSGKYLIDNLNDDNKYTEIITSNIRFLNLNFIDENKNITYMEPNAFTSFIDKMSIEMNKCFFNKSLFSYDYFFTIDFNNLIYNFSNVFFNNINNCLNAKYNRIFIPINIRLNDNKGHSNLIIIDKNEKLIYYYEPHGKKFNHNLTKYIDIKLYCIKIIKDIFKLHEYNTSDVFDKCKYGPQAIQSLSINFINKSGYCLSWSLLMMHLILLNSNISINKIVSWVNLISPHQLNCYIQKYTTYIDSISNPVKDNNNNNSLQVENRNVFYLNTNDLSKIKESLYNHYKYKYNIGDDSDYKLFIHFHNFSDLHFEIINKIYDENSLPIPIW